MLRGAKLNTQITDAQSMRDVLFKGRNAFAAVHADGVGSERYESTVGRAPWTMSHTVAERALARVPCGNVLEVGSWTGTGTIRMASVVKALCTGGRRWPSIVALDTWLGSPEFYLMGNASWWEDTGFMTKDGVPHGYLQYLFNIKHAHQDDIVVPFPQSTTIGVKVLFAKGIRFDAIYIDASHEYEDVWQDLNCFWNLLRSGGIMFGDDYSAWPGVKRAVDAFASGRGLQLELAPPVKEWGVAASPSCQRCKTEWILSPKPMLTENP